MRFCHPLSIKNQIKLRQPELLDQTVAAEISIK